MPSARAVPPGGRYGAALRPPSSIPGLWNGGANPTHTRHTTALDVLGSHEDSGFLNIQMSSNRSENRDYHNNKYSNALQGFGGRQLAGSRQRFWRTVLAITPPSSKLPPPLTSSSTALYASREPNMPCSAPALPPVSSKGTPRLKQPPTMLMPAGDGPTSDDGRSGGNRDKRKERVAKKQ